MTLSGRAACLWHAFNTLGEQSGKNIAVKGQLKVLTHNIASLFHMQDVEKKLEETFASDDNIAFPDYLNFLKKELFQPLVEVDQDKIALILSLDEIDNICWYICSQSYLKQSHHILSENDVYKLWRLFNFLAETNDMDEAIYPVVVDHEEAELIFHRIVTMLTMEHKKFDFESILTGTDQLGFTQFLRVIEDHCFTGKTSAASSTVAELFDDQVAQVLKKGYLQKKSHGFTGGWKEYWCVLTLSQMRLYSSRDETELKDNLIITKTCKVENLPEKPGLTFGNVGLGAKSNRFLLKNEAHKMLEMSAPDAKTKAEWITAVESALDWSSRASSPRLLALKKRKQERAERRKRLQMEAELRQQKEEEIAKTLLELDAEKRARLIVEERILHEEARRLEEQLRTEETKRLLDDEKLAREKAELLWQEEAHLRALEQQRLREMEQMKMELEILLERECQAKQEKEIVKAMQAKILQEEFERREQLEKMQADLEKLLQEEQLKNIGLEEIRLKQEAFIRDEQERLKALEMEKMEQELEHQAAVLKLKETELLKTQMEEKLKVKEEEQAKFAATLAKNSLSIQLPTHRGPGSFADADFTKRRDLTPVLSSSPSFNVHRVCRTPISPPIQPDIIRSTDSSNSGPPVPPKRGKRNNLTALGNSRQESQEEHEQVAPTIEAIHEQQTAGMNDCSNST